MAKRKAAARRYRVAEVCATLEEIAPLGLAQSWDNVGLLAGDETARVRRMLCCIDLTPAVVSEALTGRHSMVLAYHPPIFKPISALRVPGHGTEEAVFRCLRLGIAIYAPHTALDAAAGGTNDVLAQLCGLTENEPLEYVDEPGRQEFKLVVFVPPNVVESVAEALFAAGAGRIGDYTHCSYRSPGQGTFFGSEATNPAVGERGRLECVEEQRLETVVPASALPAVVAALRRAHPYEEPAFDLYPLKPAPVPGLGCVGTFTEPTTLRQLARRLKRRTPSTCVQLVGPPEREITRALVLVGAAGSIPFRTTLGVRDVIVTGEIRHHDALTISRRGCCALALGHWASERPVLKPLADRLASALPGLDVQVSQADCDPFLPA